MSGKEWAWIVPGLVAGCFIVKIVIAVLSLHVLYADVVQLL